MEEELAKRRERIAALRGIPEENEERIKQPVILDRGLLSGTTVEGMAAWLMEEAQTLATPELETVKPNADFFVALWHDLEWHLLAWAWLCCLFILVEQAVKALGKSLSLPRWLQAAIATLNIQFLVIANLTGFALGVRGMRMMISQIYSPQGIFFLLGSYTVLYAMVQCMFKWREEERRRGKYLNY